MHSAIKVAKHFVDKANEAGQKDMTLLKLIKIVYVAHGWMLGIYGKPLVSEDVEAWKYGPVIPELYNETNQFGRNHITDLSDDFKCNLTQEEQSIVDQTWDIYSQYTASQLVALTHKKGTPWYAVTEGGSHFGRGLIIPNDKISDYYKSFVS